MFDSSPATQFVALVEWIMGIPTFLTYLNVFTLTLSEQFIHFIDYHTGSSSIKYRT